MATSSKAFLVELYEEYLEEASFLYEQRRGLYNNPEVAWKKIGEFENRLEAHLDGLVVGGSLALDVCKRRAEEGDFGELFAALSVLCRQNHRDLVLSILEKLDPEDAEKTSAAADALKYELPEVFFQDFVTLLDAGDPKLAPILARALGYRRVPCGPQLYSALRRCAAGALPEVIWAVGRVAYRPAHGLLLDYLRSEDEPVRAVAAVALERIGEPAAIDYCLENVASSDWPVLPLALAGGRREIAILTELAAKSASQDHLIALGVLGDPTAIPLLMDRLEQPAAATAIECITGAGLYETVFIPDDIDEEALFESEREQLKQGKPLDRGDGRPYGSVVTRISQKREDWLDWWETNAARYVPGVRYRGGDPYSPTALSGMLASDNVPHRLRYFCSEELVTRYGQDFGLEMDMPVTHQTPKLAEAAAWSCSNNSRFQAGVWHFAGHRIV
jgi:uncharacterized protein (TIGR02270 family)